MQMHPKIQFIFVVTRACSSKLLSPAPPGSSCTAAPQTLISQLCLCPASPQPCCSSPCFWCCCTVLACHRVAETHTGSWQGKAALRGACQPRTGKTVTAHKEGSVVGVPAVGYRAAPSRQGGHRAASSLLRGERD